MTSPSLSVSLFNFAFGISSWICPLLLVVALAIMERYILRVQYYKLIYLVMKLSQDRLPKLTALRLRNCRHQLYVHHKPKNMRSLFLVVISCLAMAGCTKENLNKPPSI